MEDTYVKSLVIRPLRVAMI